MHSDYIEQRNGGYYVAGTRISPDSVVYPFNAGDSPEAIRENLPVLKRAQIGADIRRAIAFYLDHEAEIATVKAARQREPRIDFASADETGLDRALAIR